MPDLFGKPTQDELKPVSGSIKSKYGFLPTSVWYCTKESAANDFIRDNDPELREKNDSLGGGTSMSEFDSEVADRIIKYWSNPGDQIVDPFCGRATRAICAMLLNRDYQGYEIAPGHHAFTLSRMQNLERNPSLFGNWGKGEIVLGDGVKMAQTPDGFADMIMTCPPYWNTEKYESVPGQLSDIDDFEDFQGKMAEHALEAYRVLKPGKFAVYVVNDFRRGGKYYAWHSRMVDDFEAVGFTMHDMVINKVNSVAVLGVGQLESRRNVAKCHEFLLIFRR